MGAVAWSSSGAACSRRAVIQARLSPLPPRPPLLDDDEGEKDEDEDEEGDDDDDDDEPHSDACPAGGKQLTGKQAP